jgi:flagellar export protein FliJ
MRRYRFRLESVLRVRRLQADAALGEFARATNEVVRLDGLLGTRTQEYGPAGVSIAEGATSDYLATVATRARRGEAVVLAHRDSIAGHQRREHQRAAWQAAERRVSALERLDERQREEHWADTLRGEEREIDDVVVSRWGVASWTD